MYLLLQTSHASIDQEFTKVYLVYFCTLCTLCTIEVQNIIGDEIHVHSLSETSTTTYNYKCY